MYITRTYLTGYIMIYLHVIYTFHPRQYYLRCFLSPTTLGHTSDKQLHKIRIVKIVNMCNKKSAN